MISQGWKNQRRTGEALQAPLKVMRVNTRPSGRASWLDSMLGQGSSKTVESAVLRMRVVGPGTERAMDRRPKGYLRIAVATVFLGALAMHFKPWQSIAKSSMPALVRVEKPAESADKLPVVDSGEDAIALWRAESGQWYGVDAKARLSRISESEARARLNLPRIEGAPLASEEKRGGRVLKLDMDPAQLEALLPLRSDLAAELDAIQVQGNKIRLRIQGGMTADLGEGNYKEKQAKLAAVLADLQARKKRALSVDLRFENTAVVRLAAR